MNDQSIKKTDKMNNNIQLVFKFRLIIKKVNNYTKNEVLRLESFCSEGKHATFQWSDLKTYIQNRPKKLCRFYLAILFQIVHAKRTHPRIVCNRKCKPFRWPTIDNQLNRL